MSKEVRKQITAEREEQFKRLAFETRILKRLLELAQAGCWPPRQFSARRSRS